MSRESNLNQVMKWVVQSGFQVESVSEERHDFVVTVSENERLPQLQIIHKEADSAYVLIVGLVSIPENDRKSLKSANLRGFEEFIWNLKLDLLKLDVDFMVLGPEKDPDSWEIQKRLYLDAAAGQFYEVCSRVKSALISIIWSYKRELDRNSG